jgi:hypothetical protein
MSSLLLLLYAGWLLLLLVLFSSLSSCRMLSACCCSFLMYAALTENVVQMVRDNQGRIRIHSLDSTRSVDPDWESNFSYSKSLLGLRLIQEHESPF